MLDRTTTSRPDTVSAPTRRRGSVMILVMTLLGILFVTGIAFLASMKFESDTIDIMRHRSRSESGVDSVATQIGSLLHDGTTGIVGSYTGSRLAKPFGDREIGDTIDALGELPGVHNFFAPVEPYDASAVGGSPTLQFRWFTDLGGLRQTPNLRRLEVEPAWTSGVAVPSGLYTGLEPFPVDSDGDGVTDTFQFDLADLGFSGAQVAALSSLVNPASMSGGSAHLGMRIIAHGGLVNLNDSHPWLIANVLGNARSFLRTTAHPNFRHRPSLPVGNLDRRNRYSPVMEEHLLRRRVLLPPRDIPMSLLHGNLMLQNSDDGYADLATFIYPPDFSGRLGYETVFDGGHRHYPFDYANELYDPTNANSPLLWDVRMNPDVATAFGSTSDYDKRHLLTTVSHDDLLSRGGQAKLYGPGTTGLPVAVGDVAMRRRMAEINKNLSPPGCELPFEYAEYPHSPRQALCSAACFNDPSCRKFDSPDIGLQLSLPWLDQALADGVLDVPQREKLIHDVFMMLVRNAKGLDWDEHECSGSFECYPTERCSTVRMGATDGVCEDVVTGLTRRSLAISRTAASLTANMIDYMDGDDQPTRVALRSFDFRDPNVGLDAGLSTGNPSTYVYGLERQPFITEVVTQMAPDPNNEVTGRAIEIYNPYATAGLQIGGDQDGDGKFDYWIAVSDGSTFPPQSEWILWPTPSGGSIGDEPFTVFVSDATKFTIDANARTIDGAALSSPLTFNNGSIIYLVRRIEYTFGIVNIVVDQFDLKATYNIGRVRANLAGVYDPALDVVLSVQRPHREPIGPADSIQWKAVVPETREKRLAGADFSPSLGTWFDAINGLGSALFPHRPVQIPVANTGRFSPFTDPTTGTTVNGAFPTTGSMLLLMRHANRSVDDAFTDMNLAFNTWLDDTDPAGMAEAISRTRQIDNGRMPVFDAVVGQRKECVGGVSEGRWCTTNTVCGLGACKNVARFAHRNDPTKNPEENPSAKPPVVAKPGRLGDLPWGQLIFDYFTALPLDNEGPYHAGFKSEPLLPRVDLDGLRVHGRININAAPWKVLDGLPVVPVATLPAGVREMITIRLAALGANETISTELARAIVAYRDARNVVGPGNYDNALTGRGWGQRQIAARRGTGFLTVGELANVRNLGAAAPAWQIDGGQVAAPSGDYVGAVALLVALQDWVTTRSHVFTLYGALRGDPDVDTIPEDASTLADDILRARDVDTRAIRFRETVDRLPTLGGAPAPVHVGRRYEGPYLDVRND